jgi:hypothetical protein
LRTGEERIASLTVIQDALEIIGSPGTAAIVMSPDTKENTIENELHQTFDRDYSHDVKSPQ